MQAVSIPAELKDKIMDTNQWELSKQSLESILSESRYTPREFVKALGSPSFMALLKHINPLALVGLKAALKLKVYSHLPRLDRRFAKECGRGRFAKRCWEIRSVTFTYRSQAVDGRDILLSGRVTFLANQEQGTPHQAKTISLHMHQAFFHEEWAPSKTLMFMPLKVLWDSVVIEPDLQKWGINYGIESDGGGSALHMARQLADCIVAALEIMQQHGVSLAPEGYTTNWGSSQGALPTLMFAKWYDTEAPQWFKDALRLRATFSAEGAAHMPQLMNYLYRHPEDIDINFILLLAYFKAFSPSQLGGYQPEEFVPRWYLDTKFHVNGRELTLFDAVSHHYPQLTDPYFQKMKSFDRVYAPDMLTADGKVDTDSPKLRAWMACLQTYNNMEGWTPAHSVYMAHCPSDDMVPYEAAHNLYRTISNDGRNPLVHMLAVPAMRFIPNGGMRPHFIIAFVGLLIMTLYENPEDMRRPYKSVQ